MSFVDEAEAQSVVEQLRTSADSINWVAFDFVSNDQVKIASKGSNGLEGLQQHFKDDSTNYGVLNVELSVEGALVNKFIFIVWVGPEVKPAVRARTTQHKLPIYKFVNTVLQLGGEFQATSREELTLDLVKGKLLGTRVASENAVEGESLKSKGAGASEKFTIDKEEEVKAALEELRTRDHATNWIRFGYEAGKEDVVYMISKGSGTVDSFVAELSDDVVEYIFYCLKVTEAGATHLKYIAITWVGCNVKPLHKARSSQHRWHLYNFAKLTVQMAGEIQILTRSDLNEDMLKEKLSGSKDLAIRSEAALRAAALADEKKKTRCTS